MSKYIYLVAVILILGLCGWVLHQSKQIDGLRAENQTQAQTIEQQQKANQRLTDILEQERQAVEKSQQIANELRNKVEIVQNEIKSILAQDSCAKADLPNGVADSIKRLH
ncbi:DUF2570 family protein [Mannheimia haemolytica]|nr:DUF2570 family protein [Mannheimia haemolytica]AJE08343.1 DUF2570 domain-containing protein [Mannheimia haemolytica USDA-ARS-USMARC-184]KYL07026.1 bacteriophage protein [Mannheimia haemolytica]MDW0617865.1 DUF2570 family protein [Mannheimia haemolytica]UFK42240.1 DUF2570 domain-containing protein [Mannheimia haemolytica]UQX61954.1 DUF2570 domain-containing protein [Mannheimia haemolytica]